jgi:L-rhamnose mutarotase
MTSLEGFMKRFGQTLRLKPESIELYKKEHANVWSGVLAQIKKANIQNYSIFLHGNVLFAYFEYVGSDFDADMSNMAKDPETQRWWAYMEPMQQQWEGTPAGDWWLTMEEVFHTD